MGKNLAINRFIISAYLIAYFIRKEKKMQESRFDRLKRFSEIFLTARINAGRSQDWMSKELGISRKTVQNWESGISSPDFFDAIEWFRILNMNPFKATYETNQQIGTLICKDNIQPDLDNFTNAINEASLAAVKHCEGYVNFKIEE